MSTPANGGDKINFQNPISFENDEDAEEDEEDDELVESSAAAKMAPPKSPRESEKSFEQDPGTGAEPSTPVLNVLNTPESQERELDKTVLLNKVWGTFDIDGNGSLDAGEIQMVLTHMGMDANEETVQSAMQRMNTSRKGQVDFPEFAKWFEENDSEDKQYDFFTIFSNALELLAGAAESRMEIREHMKQCFKDVPNWSAQLDQASFCNTLESHLKIQLDADMREALVVEVHSGPNAQGDADSGTFTILEFETWWDHFFEYDAVDPFRAALLALEESNVISPNSNFRGNWDLVQAALLAYIAFALPYRLGFSDAIEFLSGWFWWDLLVDIYFIADLFLNFRTAVLTPDGQLLYEQKDIARAYLRGWFTIDFASCLPFGYVEYFVDKDEGSKGSSNKAVRMLRLFRLLKLLRLVRIKRILDRWEEEMYGARALKIGKLIAAVSVFAHWGACTWYFVGAPVETEEYLLANNISDKDDVIGLGREVAPGWVFSRYGGAVLLDENDEGYVGYGQRYFDSVFWSAMSVLTIQVSSHA
jgi:Ca2+-binding EF-hand superfamily protein